MKLKNLFKKHWKQILKYSFLIFLIVDGIRAWYLTIMEGQPYLQLMEQEKYLYQLKFAACVLYCIEWGYPMGYIIYKIFKNLQIKKKEESK